MGDPAGIGPELAAFAWLARERSALPPFAYVGDADDLIKRTRAIGLDRCPQQKTTIEEVNSCFPHALPVLHQQLAVASKPGKPDVKNAPAVIAAIDYAVSLIANGSASGLITGPVQKSVLSESGFSFSGHTEYLGVLARQHFSVDAYPVMMLVCPELRVAPVTTHIPLGAVPTRLTTSLIIKTGQIVTNDLKKLFGISQPRLAICGLNPHAGENGTLGREDRDIISPAVAFLRAEGIAVTGPLPADTLFHRTARIHYDAILAMYHDQGLVPVKTIAFDTAVNVTLGLPFVRTSPDHGTALDLAATGTASPHSLIEAILLAAKMVENKAA